MADKKFHASWRAIEVKGGTGVDGGHAVACSCGEQSPFFTSPPVAADWWQAHVDAPPTVARPRSS